jgi:hypothetical protein
MVLIYFLIIYIIKYITVITKYLMTITILKKSYGLDEIILKKSYSFR